MSQLYSQGLANMKAADIDARLGRRPIERYEWPLGAAMLALTMSILIGERKRVHVRARSPRWSKIAVPATALLFIFAGPVFGTATGLNLYREGKYNDAYQSFQQDLNSHPDSSEKEKIEFDAGAAAFKMGDYNKALQSFSDSLLSSDKALQENSHFNLGRTLEDRADMDETNDNTLKDLTDAASHYESTLRLNPKNEAAKANLEEVRKKIERLKQHPKQKPTQPPQQQNKKENKNALATASPSAGGQDRQSSRKQEQPEESPSPGGGEDQMPSPSPGEGEGEGENATPSATPTSSPQKKLAGEIKGANGDKQPESPQQAAQLGGAEPEKEGQMSEKQAELLLKSMKDEEQRVQLDERKVRRHVYNDW